MSFEFASEGALIFLGSTGQRMSSSPMIADNFDVLAQDIRTSSR